jgi:hypothetical protein
VSKMGGMFPHVIPAKAGIQEETGPRLTPG